MTAPSGPNRIREIRTSRRLTQEELAERTGATKTAISKLELSQRGLNQSWMDRLAKALDCAPAELLPLSDFPAREATLLSLFRSMPPDGQDQLLKIATALAPP